MSKDADWTHNLEVKLAAKGDDENTAWVWQKNGAKQGLPSEDWDEFWSSLADAKDDLDLHDVQYMSEGEQDQKYWDMFGGFY